MSENIWEVCSQFGPWAVIAVLSGGIAALWRWARKLHQELRESHQREIQMAEKVLPLLEELRMLFFRGGP